jgi:hypothetical protein
MLYGSEPGVAYTMAQPPGLCSGSRWTVGHDAAEAGHDYQTTVDDRAKTTSTFSRYRIMSLYGTKRLRPCRGRDAPSRPPRRRPCHLAS